MFQSIRENLLKTEKTSHLLGLVSLIIFMAMVGRFATDMYVPSLPAITKAFSTSATSVQYTITVFLLGLGLSQLIYGPLADRYGRRRLILIGLVIGGVGSLLCVFAHSVNQLILGRVIQGIGMGGGISLCRAMLSDLFEGPRLAQMTSYLSMAFAVAPAVAPAMGGYMQQWFGWQSVFEFVMVYALIALFVSWAFMPETNQHRNKHATEVKVMLHNYFELLTNPTFLGYLASASLALSGVIAYVTMGPFILQNDLGLTPVQYGCLALIITGAMMLWL